ncbi:hypothetical protein I4U23_015954 [Adineta vaga]|nr:hypothetical protein I4U23_015954 [Adineta vaga]
MNFDEFSNEMKNKHVNRTQFIYHIIKQGDLLEPTDHYFHMYSLPFRSIAQHMLYLISINWNFNCFHEINIILPDTILDEDIFHHLRFLHFQSTYYCPRCTYLNLLSRLLNRMPKLEYLITSDDNFLSEQRQYPSIKQFISRKFNLKSIDTKIKCFPKLTTLSHDHLGIYSHKISTFVSSFFFSLSSFKSISSHYGSRSSYTYAKYALYSLRHIILDLECGIATFNRRNF